MDDDDNIARASATLGRDINNELISTTLEIQVRPVAPDVFPFRETLAGIGIGEDDAQLKLGNSGGILATQ